MKAFPPARLRTWAVAGALALAATLLMVGRFTPRLVVWRGLGIPDARMFPEINRAEDVLRQLHDPFGHVSNPSNWAIEWRLLFPLIGHVTHLPDRVFLALPALGCLLVLATAAAYLRRRGWRPDETLAALLVLGACPWFFVSSGWLAYFDSWLVLALLICTLTRSPWVLASAVLLAPWIDERFLFLLPACLLLREGVRREEKEARSWRNLRREMMIVGVALVPFIGIRVGAVLGGQGRGPAEVMNLANSAWHRLAWRDYAAGAWQGLRFGWVAVALGGVYLGRSSPRLAVSLSAAAIIALAAMFAVAADFSRSASTLAPLLLAALGLVWAQPGRTRRLFVWSLAALNLAAPAVHVVDDTRVELRMWPQELELWRHPPEVLRADFYNLRATQFLIEGQTAEALTQLDYAVQLDSAFQPAQINRSTAYARLERWAEALNAAEVALALDATVPRAWYARALARSHTGDWPGAQADAKQVMAMTSPGDPLREKSETLRSQRPPPP